MPNQFFSWLANLLLTFFFAETMSFPLFLNCIHTGSQSWSCSRLHWSCRSVEKLRVFPDSCCPGLSLFDWGPHGTAVTWTLSVKWLSLFKEVILTGFFFFQGNMLNLRPYSWLYEWNWFGVALKKAQPGYLRISLAAAAIWSAYRKMRIVQGMLFLRGLWWSVTASAGEVAASDRGQSGFAPKGLYNWGKSQVSDTEWISCQTEASISLLLRKFGCWGFGVRRI